MKFLKLNSGFSNIEKWSIILLILLSFSGVSVMNIGKAMLTPLHLMMGMFISYELLNSKKIVKKISVTFTFLLVYILVINILNYKTIRPTSVLYSVIYMVEVAILYNMLRQCRPKALLFAFRLIIYLYFASIFIGFVMTTLGIRGVPIIDEFVRVYYAPGSSEGRPMGFSSEPSYAAIIIAVSFLCYSHIRRHVFDKDTAKMISLIFLSVIFSKSAYGFIFIAILFLDWGIVLFRKSDSLTKNLFPFCLIVLITVIGYLSTKSEDGPIRRIVDFTSVAMDNTYTGKAKLRKLQEADGSAFARIGPTYLLFTQSGDDNSFLLYGKGAGAAGGFMSKFLEGILVDEGRDSFDTGFIPAFIFDYGIFGTILFILFLGFSFKNLPLPFWILFIVILPNANFNTQVFWFTIICFMFMKLVLDHRRTKPTSIKRIEYSV